MLRFLRVRNLAVIEAVEVEFEPGFNVLTGETGAGKSILVEAVGLLLGARASPDLIRTGEAQASVEAIFDTVEGTELVVRRQITVQGRSRSFVGEVLVTTAALRDVTAGLVELHGQHEHQTLLDPLAHLPLLDAHAGLEPLAAAVAHAFTRVQELRNRLQRVHMDVRERSARLELITFQLGELERAAPRPGEDEELAAVRDVLASAERVQRLCEEGYAALYESDAAILSGLGGVWKRVAELAALDPRFAPYAEARDGIKGQLEDLAFFLRGYASGIDASPARLQDVEDRLALLDRLKRKYGPTLAEVIARREALSRERDLLTGGEAGGRDLEIELRAASADFLGRARELSARRRAAGATMAQRLAGLLAELAMEKTRVEVRFAPELDEMQWTERGVDRAEFYVSPNLGEDLRPLARIVSGGELSRVMLALKTLAHAGQGARTLVFDEVDAGIGGRVAAVVGDRLRALGGRTQVLCITHLPQIAAAAGVHFRIEKTVRAGRTVTGVERLSDAGRIGELSRMIGGPVVTAAVMDTARDLLARGAAGDADGRAEPPLHRPAAAPERERKSKTKAKGESESRPRWRKS